MGDTDKYAHSVVLRFSQKLPITSRFERMVAITLISAHSSFFFYIFKVNFLPIFREYELHSKIARQFPGNMTVECSDGSVGLWRKSDPA